MEVRLALLLSTLIPTSTRDIGSRMFSHDTSFQPAQLTQISSAALADTSAHGKGREDVAEHYEKHKQEQIQEQKEGKGKWKHELSSNSEQAVG